MRFITCLSKYEEIKIAFHAFLRAYGLSETLCCVLFSIVREAGNTDNFSFRALRPGKKKSPGSSRGFLKQSLSR